ncbi:MAG TPA: GlsB/YeaQ/YmgE family stress response membrane protein [Blastocatellia bacterium]|nr:GlsB/YeaQ/YmgE family stress response membrane protein [Blastocatellia bacterium]
MFHIGMLLLGIIGGTMHLIWLLIIGLVVGALARLILPGKDPMGLIATALLGIAGSFLGGLLGRLILGEKDGNEGAMLRPSFLFSLLGAILLLWLWRKFGPKTAAA